MVYRSKLIGSAIILGITASLVVLWALAGPAHAIQEVAAGQSPALPAVWTPAAELPYPWLGSGVQCPEDLDRFYLVGGLTTGEGELDDVSGYDILTGTWQTDTIADLPQANRAPSLACYQGKIYAAGGSRAGQIQDELYIYDILSNTWITKESLPEVSVGGALGAWDGKLFLVGGNKVGSPWIPHGSVHVYDIASNDWTPNGGLTMPIAANFAGYAQAGPYLYLLGGLSGVYTENLSSTQRYNMAENTWEQGPAFGSRRALTGLAINQQYLYALGGDANGGVDWRDATDAVERLDHTLWPAGAWTSVADPLTETVLSPGSFCSNSQMGGEIWAVGGRITTEDLNLYRGAEPCLSSDYTFSLEPETASQAGQWGEILTYLLTLTNTGDLADAYETQVTGQWTTTLEVGEGVLDPGQSRPLTITVEIPVASGLAAMETTTVTLVSRGDATQIASSLLTTTAQYLPVFLPSTPRQ